MSFDGFVLRSVLHEWTEAIEGGRIIKIKQPTPTDIYMTVRKQGKNHTILFSAHPSFARIHFSSQAKAGPTEPPMFCRMLRKHIEGGWIRNIEQKRLERIAVLSIEGTDEIGDREEKKLVMEVMGKHSNLMLLDKNGKIIESIKHVPPAVNRHRSILPGQPYTAPPDQKKQDPLLADETTVLKVLDFNAGRLDQQLVRSFTGMSPLLAKEIVKSAGIGHKDQLVNQFLHIMEDMKNFNLSPQVIQQGKKEFFYILPLTHIEGESQSFSTVNDMLFAFYEGKAERDRVKQQSFDLERFIRNQLKKNEKKKKKLQHTAVSAEKALENQKLGELLTAHMHLVQTGDTEVEVIDYYDEANSTITIALDPEKSPADNAQWYFGRYNKAKNARIAVKEQIRSAEQEIVYFEGLIQQLESAAQADIAEIREELEEGGYVKTKSRRKVKKKQQKPKPDPYRSSEGIDILVGKNNKQNEYLTSRLARRSDTWLHTKNIPGSHVVIRAESFTDETLSEAAQLAAWFSKSRESSSVPVDYTLIRHVKKPNGAKPGYVTYDEQKTLYVTPDAEVIRTLKVNHQK